MKVTIIDAVSAWVMEQQIFDARGRLRARSMAEGYRRDPRTGLYVPTAVQVECPEAQFKMRVNLGRCRSISCRATRPSCGACPLSRFAGGQPGQPEPALRPAAWDVGEAVGWAVPPIMIGRI